jgi:hypothetical protein
MKRITVLSVLCVVFLVTSVGPLWAPAGIGCDVENSYDRQLTVVSFTVTNGLVSFPIGQAMNPTALARHGFQGVEKGDEIQATWQGGQKFTFLHVSSGKSVEITFPKDKAMKWAQGAAKQDPMSPQMDADEH